MASSKPTTRSTRSGGASAIDLTTQRDLLSKLYETVPIATRLAIRAEPTLSRVGQPLQFGLFAKDLIPRKTKVVYYGGLLRLKQDISDETSHVRSMRGDYVLDGNIYASTIHRPIPDDDEALVHWCAIDSFKEPVHAQFGPSPIGYLANSSGSKAHNNVNIQYHTLSNGLLDVPYMVATRDIQPGEQILCGYGNEGSKAHSDEFVPL